jgi:hypothetical protein
MSRKLHSILLDLQTELNNEILTDTVEVRGRKFEIRLLTEEETAYAFGLVRSNNTIELALSARLANLSIGIRSINGVSVADIYSDEYLSLTPEELEQYSNDSLTFVYAKLFYNWLKVQPPSFIGELSDKWQALETRRVEANKQIKNSSGESSVEDTKKS